MGTTSTLYFTFEIEETHVFWPQAALMMRRPDTVDIVSTIFSATELASAELLVMEPSWHYGYPQPEDHYAELTYDPAGYCATCGVGRVQLIPFRMREPKWGNRQIVQLNWVFDEYFVTPNAWEATFKPFGVECLPVMHHKTGRPLQTVVQLKIPALATSTIDSADVVRLPTECCNACNRIKFHPFTRGRFPHVEIPAGVHMAKTREYFGSGASGWQQVLVSQPLYRAIRELKLKGAEFGVVREAGQSAV